MEEITIPGKVLLPTGELLRDFILTPSMRAVPSNKPGTEDEEVSIPGWTDIYVQTSRMGRDFCMALFPSLCWTSPANHPVIQFPSVFRGDRCLLEFDRKRLADAIGSLGRIEQAEIIAPYAM